MKLVRLIPLFLLTAVSVFAQNTCDQLVPKALETYGCLDTLRGYRQQTANQILAQAGKDQTLTDAQKAELSDVILNAISADRLIKNVETSMIANCDANEMKTVVDQLQTPLLQKMIKFESANTDPAMAAKLQQATSLPDVQSPPEKRSQLVKRLLTATGGIDVAIASVVASSRGMMDGLGAPAPTDGQLAEMRKQLEAGLTQPLTTMTVAMYHDASDEELGQYIDLLNTKPFHDFNQSFAESMAKGFGEESRQVGLAMKKLGEKMRAEREKAAAPAVTPKQ